VRPLTCWDRGFKLHQGHGCLSVVLSGRGYHQVFIKSQQNWLKQGVEQFTLKSINLFILFGIRWNCLRSGRNQSLYLFIRRVIKETSNYTEISLLSTTYRILSNVLLSRLTPYADEIIWDHVCAFWHNKSTTDHIFCIHQILGKKWEYNEAVHQLFIDFKEAYDSVRREVLYNILIEFGIPMKLVRLIKVFLNETCSRVQVGKHLCDMFPIRNGLKKETVYRHWFSTLL
jgi:hypothetical protein